MLKNLALGLLLLMVIKGIVMVVLVPLLVVLFGNVTGLYDMSYFTSLVICSMYYVVVSVIKSW